MFFSFPHINQFRQVVRVLTDRARFVGKNENGEPIFDGSRPIGIKTFIGTPKVHGTNAGITLMPDGRILAQSRSRVLEPGQDDNLGFRAWVESVEREDLMSLFSDAIMFHSDRRMDLAALDEPVTIFGEWAGKGIQSGVAVSKADRFFYVFAVQWGDELRMIGRSPIIGGWRGIPSRVVNTKNGETSVVSADDTTMGVVRLTVNLDDPVEVAKAINDMNDLTLKVEERCPVAALWGIDGIGEGVVWHLEGADGRDGAIFKVKGEKHSVSKVKTLPNANVEKVASVKEFVEKTCTDNRLRQGIAVLKEQGKPVEMSSMGDFIRWVHGDIAREEADALEAAGLTSKDIGGPVATVARQWFKGHIAGLDGLAVGM